jgi:hypothetical protein
VGEVVAMKGELAAADAAAGGATGGGRGERTQHPA